MSCYRFRQLRFQSFQGQTRSVEQHNEPKYLNEGLGTLFIQNLNNFANLVTTEGIQVLCEFGLVC